MTEVFIERDFKEAYIRMKERALQAERDCEELRYQLRTADSLLKPLAAVADSGDHFNHDNAKSICSWRIAGERHYGPTMGQCRAARDFVRARLPIDVKSPGGPDA